MLSVTPMKFTSVSNPRLAQALRVQGIFGTSSWMLQSNATPTCNTHFLRCFSP